jgi:hypothetical protein
MCPVAGPVNRHLRRLGMKGISFRICLMLAVVAASAIGSQSFAQTNLLVNPGFEDGGGSYDGWFTFGNGVQLSLPGGDDIIRTGVAASKIYGEFTGCPGSPQFDVGGYGQAFTPTVGKIYEFNGYAFVSTGDAIPGTETCLNNRCIAKVVFFDADSAGYEISGNEIVIGDGNTVTGQWNEFSVSAPVPPGALRVEALILFLQPGCDTGSVFVDDCSFYELPGETGPNLLTNPGFDSGLTGWNIFGNAWSDFRNWAVRTAPGAAKMYSSFDPESDTGMYQTFPATPDTGYQLDVYTLNTCREDAVVDTNDNFALAQIRFRNAADSVLASKDTVIADNTSPLGTWTKHTLYALAPAGTDSVDAFLLFISPTLMNGAFWFDDVVFRVGPQAGIPGEPGVVSFELHQNRPNPFSSSTTIRLDMARPGHVSLRVYNVKGELVSTVVDGHMAEGPTHIRWDAKDDSGVEVASGIYFYQLTSEGSAQTKKMLFLH